MNDPEYEKLKELYPDGFIIVIPKGPFWAIMKHNPKQVLPIEIINQFCVKLGGGPIAHSN